MIGVPPFVVVAGAGNWGRNHILTLIREEFLGAVVDSSQEALDRVKRDLSGKFDKDVVDAIPFCQSLENVPLADTCLPLVVVATPPNTHYELAKLAMERFKGVLIEKPMCLRYEEAQELVTISKTRGITLMVGHLMRYSSTHQNLLQYIQEGENFDQGLGEVKRVKMSRMKFGTIRKEENVLWSFAPHDISLLLAIAGNKLPRSVRCIGQKVVSLDMEDFVTLFVDFEGGLRGEIECSWLHPYRERRTVVYGTKGFVVLDEAVEGSFRPVLQYFCWSGQPSKDGKRFEAEMRSIPGATGRGRGLSYKSEAFLWNELRSFIDCCMEDFTPTTDGSEGARVVLTLEAATKSLAKGGAEIVIEEFLRRKESKLQHHSKWKSHQIK